MATSTDQHLDALLASADPWDLLEALATTPPPDLLACIAARLPQLRSQPLERATQLLAALRAPARPLLLEVLGRGASVTAQALGALSVRETPLDYERLLPWLRASEPAVVQAAIGAAGFVGDPRLIEEVFGLWDSPRRLDVALCLGRMRAVEHTPELVALLTNTLHEGDRQPWEHCAVALELMADPGCVPEVRRLLETAPEDRVWSLVQILRAASGEDRLADWIDAQGKANPAELRRAWLAPAAGPAGVRAFAAQTSSMAEILLQGSGRVRMGYPPMITAGNWARWSRALYWDDEILYHANSHCGTCETFLARAGASRPRIQADQVASALAEVTTVSRSLLDALLPALLPLPAGRALIALVEVELERIDGPGPQGSWYAKRSQYRKSDDPDDSDDDDELPQATWPGTAHYQAIELLETDPPTSLTVMPTQPIDGFDEQVIAERTTALTEGRPAAALAVGWFEYRYVLGRYPEAMLQLVALDGHHTLEAHARARRAARLVVVCPFSFGSIPEARRHLEQLASPRE